MTSSVDDLRDTVEELRSKGLNTQQIADEMSLSQTTIKWLSSGGVGSEDRPVSYTHLTLPTSVLV